MRDPNAASPAPSIHLRRITLRYGDATLFANLDLDLPGGSFSVLLGGSGVGKTSLLRIAAGLDGPAGGSIDTGDNRPLAGRVAYMAQQDLLCPWLDVGANVGLGDRLRGRRADRARIAAMLEAVGLAGLERARPSALSGGMRQRVALARTLYEDRPVVMMDEPFSALDTPTRLRIQDLAARLLAGRTVLLITHDALEAGRLADRLLVLSGRPARLSAHAVPSGPTPRPGDAPDVLAAQGALLRTLSAGLA